MSTHVRHHVLRYGYYSYYFYLHLRCCRFHFFFFFNDTAPTEIYPLSLHAPLPISGFFWSPPCDRSMTRDPPAPSSAVPKVRRDRKSTRLNSSHLVISYAVFCLKKKKQQ